MRRILIISKNFDNRNKPVANEQIPASEVLVIDTKGENLGKMKLEEAIKAASKENLDLVCVAPNAAVPVCRFMDYSKYCYEIQRKAKESKKNQKAIVLKEIRLTPIIGDNDFEVKIKNCKEFLKDGNKVKVNLYYPKGKKRLLQMDSSSKILEKFAKALEEVASIESTTQVEGKVTAIILSNKKTK